MSGKPPKYKGTWKGDTGLREATGFKNSGGGDDEDDEPLFDLNEELAKIRGDGGGKGKKGRTSANSAGSSTGVKPPSQKYGDVTIPSFKGSGKGSSSSSSSERKYWFGGDEDMDDESGEVPDPSTFFVAPKTKPLDPIDYGDAEDDEMAGNRRILREDDVPASDARRYVMDDFDKLTAADIALRQDAFINFLSLACGFSALSVTDCFTSRPPTSCRTYSDYRRYMNAAPKTMLNVTNDIISRMSDGRLNLEACINLPDTHPLYTSVAELAGTKMRKIFLDNPIRSVATRMSSIHYLTDENRILKRVYTDVMRYMRGRIPRSGYLAPMNTVTQRELNWVGN